MGDAATEKVERPAVARARRIIDWASIATIAFFLAIEVLGLADYVVRPDSHHFGTEVAGFRYISSLHYVGSILVTCLVGTLALAGRRLFGSARLATTIRMGVAAAFVALIFASSPK